MLNRNAFFQACLGSDGFHQDAFRTLVLVILSRESWRRILIEFYLFPLFLIAFLIQGLFLQLQLFLFGPSLMLQLQEFISLMLFVFPLSCFILTIIILKHVIPFQDADFDTANRDFFPLKQEGLKY